MRTIKTGLLSVGILVACLAIVSPASAVIWATWQKPVYGFEGGKAFGRMSGDFRNDRSIQAMSDTWQYDLEPGGNDVRVETDFWFYEYSNACGGSTGGTCWRFDVSKQGETSDSASWVKRSRARGLHGAADRVRGGINICEIQAWQNDPCSPMAWPSFGY